MNKAVLLIVISILLVNSVTCDSWVRLVHAVAKGPNVDIYIDNNLEASNVPYTTVSNYLTINDGNNVDFEVRVASSSDVLLSDTIDIDNNEYYTVIVSGLLSNLEEFHFDSLLSPTLTRNHPTTEPASDSFTPRLAHLTLILLLMVMLSSTM